MSTLYISLISKFSVYQRKTDQKSNDVRLKYMELLDNQLKEQKTLIKMLEKNRLSHAARQGVLDTLKQLTNSIDQRRSSIKALEHDMELSQRRLAKVILLVVYGKMFEIF